LHLPPAPNKADCWDKAAELVKQVKPERVKDFNRALLDFGALVCTARRPGCRGCCLGEGCRFSRSRRP